MENRSFCENSKKNGGGSGRGGGVGLVGGSGWMNGEVKFL